MDNYKLFDLFEEEELYEIAMKAETKLNRFYATSAESLRQDQFIGYMIDELKIYFMDKVDFEPMVIHYIDKCWQDNHSDKAYVLAKDSSDGHN